MTIEQAKDQVAQKYGWGLWINVRMNGNFHTSPDIDKMVTEATELYCQSQKAQVWEECSERWKDTINDEYNWPEPVNPYLETKKD